MIRDLLKDLNLAMQDKLQEWYATVVEKASGARTQTAKDCKVDMGIPVMCEKTARRPIDFYNYINPTHALAKMVGI